MPTIWNKHTSTYSITIWKSEESITELTNLLVELTGVSLLHPDIVKISDFKSESRRKEWLIVRLLLAKELGFFPTIKYNVDGKPSLQNSKDYVSISHSNGYVGVMLSQNNETALDIELMSDKIEKIASKFMNREDLERLSSNIERKLMLYIHWCTKEVLTKIHGKPDLIFADEIRVNIFERPANNKFDAYITQKQNIRHFEMQYYLLNNLLIVFSNKMY